jgi:hypothetical protein
MSDPALSTASLQAGRSSPAAAILAAANRLLPDLQQGARVDSTRLRAALETAFGGSDAEGLWDWKSAYDACEAATVLFLRKFGPAMRARAASATMLLAMLEKVSALFPTHTRRSEESQELQQFSTSVGLGFPTAGARRISEQVSIANVDGARARGTRFPRKDMKSTRIG